MKNLTQFLNESLDWKWIRNSATQFFLFIALHEFEKPTNKADLKMVGELFDGGLYMSRGDVDDIEDNISKVTESPEFYNYIGELLHDISYYESNDCLAELMTDLCEYINENIL